MLDTLLEKLIVGLEGRLGVKLDYLREIRREAPGALLRIALLIGFAAQGRRLPAAELHLARLGATMAEDCGACVQIEINQAVEAGVDAAVLTAALEGRADALPEALADALAFGQAVATGDAAVADPVRERLRERHGGGAVVEIAMGVAAAVTFPVLKRGMGYARSCAAQRPSVPPPAAGRAA